MSEYKLIMPKMGESITQGTILNWLVEEGATFQEGKAVLEIATDKVDSEVPSMEAGILVKKLYNEGDVVAVGETIAILSASGNADVAESVSAEVQKTPETDIPAVAAIENSVTQAQEVAAPILSTSDANRFYSPLVMNIARTEEVSMQQLETIPGTGQDGRVTKRRYSSFREKRGNSAPTLQYYCQSLLLKSVFLLLKPK